MKTIISTTYNDNYLFFLPITIWSWNKLGVDVICFMPKEMTQSDSDKINLQLNIFKKNVSSVEFHLFDCMLMFDIPAHSLIVDYLSFILLFYQLVGLTFCFYYHSLHLIFIFTGCYCR